MVAIRLRNFFETAFAPSLLFGIFYLGIFIIGVFLVPEPSQTAFHLAGLVAAILASWLAIRVADKGRWQLGFGGGAGRAVWELLLGAGFASILILLSHGLILLTTGLRHGTGAGIDWAEILVLFIPAAIHEEILFRGYAFQKLVAWNRWGGVVIGSVVFGLLHLSNDGLTALSVVNLFMAGVLLSLAYLVFQRLWLPIGVHIWWNVLSGPLLGHEVSGLELDSSLLTTHDPGPILLTGGPFGIEGSVWTLVMEAIGIVFLLWFLYRRNLQTKLSDPVAAGIPEESARTL